MPLCNLTGTVTGTDYEAHLCGEREKEAHEDVIHQEIKCDRVSQNCSRWENDPCQLLGTTD